MTTKQKKIYRTASILGLLLLGVAAMAPTWMATAEPPPATDECCDLADSEAPAPKPFKAPKPLPQLELAALGTERVEHFYRGTQPSEEVIEPANQGGGHAPTFADSDPAPENVLVQHEASERRVFPWSSGYGSMQLAHAAPRQIKGDDPTDETPPKGGPDDPTDPNDPKDPNDPDDPKDPNDPNQPPTVAVPEPPAVALLAIGVIGLLVLRRRNS